MTVFGYARAPTEQDLTLQIHALKAAGCEITRWEKVSETTTAGRAEGRAELASLLEFIRKGDTLVVTRIDRLARSIGDLQDIVRTLKNKGAALRAIEEPIDTSSAAGKAFLNLLGVFAEFETNLRRERQLEGIAQAKAKGVYKGRRPTIDREKVLELENAGLGPSAIADKLNIGRASVYRLRGTKTAQPSRRHNQEPHRPNGKYVIGPEGSPLTIADLPSPSNKRWVIRRKAEVVLAVRGGLLTLEEACQRYKLTNEEFQTWQFSIEQNGLAGLRTTRIQQYRK